MIAAGDTAPAFTARDQEGNTVALEEFRGQRVVLYFYPEDDTPGCSIEASGFQHHMEDFESAGVQVVGVSADDVASHAAFAERYSLDYPLLADPDGDIIDAYGVGGTSGRARRVTVVIDEDGIVEEVYTEVDPSDHAEQVLEAHG